jgi:hypothetical protein
MRYPSYRSGPRGTLGESPPIRRHPARPAHWKLFQETDRHHGALDPSVKFNDDIPRPNTRYRASFYAEAGPRSAKRGTDFSVLDRLLCPKAPVLRRRGQSGLSLFSPRSPSPVLRPGPARPRHPVPTGSLYLSASCRKSHLFLLNSGVILCNTAHKSQKIRLHPLGSGLMDFWNRVPFFWRG